MAILMCIAAGLTCLLVLSFLVYVTIFCLVRLVGWATGWWNEEQSLGIAQTATESVGEIISPIAEAVGHVASGW